jgi:hypothetical protein
MFVRFRQSGHRLALSIVETRWLAGKVKHEHIASLGSIASPPTVADRVAFWKALHERVSKLGNRISAESHGRILGAVHERIPMVTAEEQRALAIENDKATESFHARFRDIHAERAQGQRALIAKIERDIAVSEAAAAKAREIAAEAKERRERLERGEDALMNLSEKPVDIVRAFKEAGWTSRELRRSERMAALTKAKYEEFLKDALDRGEQAGRRAEDAALRDAEARRGMTPAAE